MAAAHSTLLVCILRTVQLLALIGVVCYSSPAQNWTLLADDPKGDSLDSSRGDAAGLAYRYDKQLDFLWFRISVYGELNEHMIAAIAIDTGDDDAVKETWWGLNKSFRFNKMISARIKRGDNGYQGKIGVAFEAGDKRQDFSRLKLKEIQIRVQAKSILIGVKRTDLTNKFKMNVIAAIMLDKQWNDEIPNSGFLTLDLAGEPNRAWPGSGESSTVMPRFLLRYHRD